MDVRGDLAALINRAATQVWYWDIKKNGLVEGHYAGSDEGRTLKEQLYEVLRKHGYLPHFNCKVETTCIVEENWKPHGDIIVSVCWVDIKGNIHGILNRDLGIHVRL